MGLARKCSASLLSNVQARFVLLGDGIIKLNSYTFCISPKSPAVILTTSPKFVSYFKGVMRLWYPLANATL